MPTFYYLNYIEGVWGACVSCGCNSNHAWWWYSWLLSGESCLIYPGAGHVLDNDTSLIALLQKEGYSVQRVD